MLYSAGNRNLQVSGTHLVLYLLATPSLRLFENSGPLQYLYPTGIPHPVCNPLI